MDTNFLAPFPQALYKALSRGCYRCDESIVKDCLDICSEVPSSGNKAIDLSAQVFGEMYYISDERYKKGHSLLVLALKFSTRKISRLLIEQGVDVETENLYAIALRGIWRSDWFDKADMLLDIADVPTDDSSNQLMDIALFFLSSDRLIPLLRYLVEHNWYFFERMYKLHFHQVWRSTYEDAIPMDDDRKKLQDFLMDYMWVLDL